MSDLATTTKPLRRGSVNNQFYYQRKKLGMVVMTQVVCERGPCIIVGIDPGVTTGVAVYNLETGAFSTFQFDEEGFYAFIETNGVGIAHCQVEKFTINAATVRKTVFYDSLYLIGFLRYAARTYLFPMALSTPAEVMAAFPDTALKRAGLHTKGLPHGNDAMRHLVAYLVKTRRIPGAQFLPAPLSNG